MGTEEIKKELIELIKLFKQAILDLGIKAEQYKVEPNWKDWSLTVTADPSILNKIGALLQSAGAKYFQSAPKAAREVLFGAVVDRPLAAATTEMKEAQPVVTCILQ